MSDPRYVEQVEYPEMVFGQPGYWIICGACDWEGPMYDTWAEAERSRWRHPLWWCAVVRAYRYLRYDSWPADAAWRLKQVLDRILDRLLPQ